MELANARETEELKLSLGDVIAAERIKEGFIKCRLIHMDGRSVVQPDILFSCDLRKSFSYRNSSMLIKSDFLMKLRTISADLP
jgi:hypothetical protein